MVNYFLFKFIALGKSWWNFQSVCGHTNWRWKYQPKRTLNLLIIIPLNNNSWGRNSAHPYHKTYRAWHHVWIQVMKSKTCMSVCVCEREREEWGESYHLYLRWWTVVMQNGLYTMILYTRIFIQGRRSLKLSHFSFYMHNPKLFCIHFLIY